MAKSKRNQRFSMWERMISGLIAFTFVFTSVVPPTTASAQSAPQTILNLPVPGQMLNRSTGFNPLMMHGITINPDNPLEFDFIIRKGDRTLSEQEFEAQSKKLIKYFLTALTVPEDQQWVNLSPYERNRMVTDTFGVTEMGRDLLAQDYLLKQLSASLMYPEDDLGEKFWKNVRQQAFEKYGTTDIPMNTFNKVWIVPENAVIYETQDTAFIVESRLKVLLEEDYLALENNSKNEVFGIDQLEKEQVEVISGLTSEIYKEIIIPAIEKEVNEGETFANLRQIFNSMTLAVWYRMALEESFLGQVYADKGKVKGVDLEDKSAKDKIYEQYLKAFQTGVYNYVKEEYDPTIDDVLPRKYFSGGTKVIARNAITRVNDRATLGESSRTVLRSYDGQPDLWSRVKTTLVEIGDVSDAVVRQAAQRLNATSFRPAISDYAMMSDTPAETSHDVRSTIKRELARAFGDRFRLYEGGFGSLDVMPKGIDKESAINNIFDTDSNVTTALYFGDEFFKTARKTGNDTPILDAKRKQTDRNIVIFSVDKNPEERTAEAKTDTIWVGEGPAATKRVLDQINAALQAGETSVTIKGQGVDSDKEAKINLTELRKTGVMLFDVDGTILGKKNENFDNQDEIRTTFNKSLENFRMGIISGNSSDEQTERIAEPLKTEGSDVANLFLYVNGGATLVSYNSRGDATKQNLADTISRDDIAKVQSIITRLLQDNLGLDRYEVEGWKNWLAQQTKEGADFEGVKFIPGFGMESFEASVVTPQQLIDAKANAGKSDPLEITNPYIENRDGVQLSIKLLPRETKIAQENVERRRMLQLLGALDLDRQQRLGAEIAANSDVRINTDVVVDFLVNFFADRGETPSEVSQETFNRYFGTRPIVNLAGFGSRFSGFLHKGMAFAGIDRNNVMNALDGAYTTPGVSPLVFIGEKILGLIVKDELLTGFDGSKLYFTVSDANLKQIESDVIINRDMLDEAKVQRYFGRSLDELYLGFVGPYGHGENTKIAIRKLDEILPDSEKVPFSQVAFGEMAEAIRPEKSNASLITYLRVLEEEANAYAFEGEASYEKKRPLAVAGGKLAAKDSTGKLTVASITGKGNFFKNNGRLVVYSDWDQIAHKKDMNGNSAAKERYDRVAADHGTNQALLEGLLEAAKSIEDPIEREKQITRLRNDPRFTFFAISNEGELFSQENLTVLVEKLNDWVRLSDAEKEYLKRHYAVIDNGNTADLLISSNTGIFRNQAVLDVIPQLEREELRNGYRTMDSFFTDYEDTTEGDERVAGRWVGVDPKDNKTKTLAWNFFRILSDRFRDQNPRDDTPIDLVFVGSAPSSIKNAEIQMDFADFYSKEYGVELGQSGLETATESEIAQDLIDNETQAAEEKLLALAQQGSGVYREELRNLFKFFASSRNQLRLIDIIGDVNDRLTSLGEKATDKEVLRNTEILQGINVQMMSEAIDAGYVGNIDALATDANYVDRLAKVYQSYRDSARARGKSEYINVQLAHTIKARLDGLNFLETVEALQTKLGQPSYIKRLSTDVSAAQEFVRTRNLLAIVASIDNTYLDYLREISRDVTLGLYTLAETGEDTISDLLPNGEAFARDMQTTKPDRKAILVTGGTAVGTLWAQSLAKTDGFRNVDVTGIVGNVDDGGSSYDIVNILNRAGYGVIPPPGDKINTLQGFMSRDKREHLMGDSGRLPKNNEAPESMVEGTAVKISETISDFNGVDRLEEDFFHFARVLLTAAKNVDTINDEILAKVDARIESEGTHTLSGEELAKYRDSRVIRTGGASIRNLYVLGFLREFGVINGSNKSLNEESIDVNQFENALQSLAEAANVSNAFVTVSSFDPKTVYARYKGYTMLLNHDGKTLPVVLEEDGGLVKVFIPKTEFNEEIIAALEIEVQDSESVVVTALDHPLLQSLDNKITVQNQNGRVIVTIGTTTWRIDDADINNGKLVAVAGSRDGEKIELANDGTGRSRDLEGTKSKTPMFTLNNSDGTTTDLFFRGRLVKMQTNVTETVNYTTIEGFGFLEGGLGLKGEVPDQVRRQNINDSMVTRIKAAQENDIVVIGPGSFYTSILPHFLVDGLGRELQAAKDRGVRVVLTLNATKDNETVNLSIEQMLEKLEAAVGKDFSLDDMLSDIIAVKEYDMPESISSQLNPIVDADIRTDPTAASSAAKKSRGPLALSQAQINQIEGRWKKLTVHGVEDALALVKTKARESGGKTSARVVHDTSKIAEILDQISPSNASNAVVQQRERTREAIEGMSQADAGKDQAMLGQERANITAQTTTKPEEVGGIDFNPELLDLQIKRDGQGIPLPVNQQSFENININGFLPVILDVTPVPNLPLILGLTVEDTENDIADNPEEDPLTLSFMDRQDYFRIEDAIKLDEEIFVG